MPKARDYISDLAASGRYHFAAEEMRKALVVSADAAKLSLYRLAKRGLVASPARGFYIIVPPEYKRLGSLPADQFLMQAVSDPDGREIVEALLMDWERRAEEGVYQPGIRPDFNAVRKLLKLAPIPS